MATYPIKLMYDESGHAFVPLTSMDAVIGEKNVQYILDAVELSPGHFQIKITDMQLDKLLNTAVIVRWPQINSTVKPSYLQLNDEEEKLLYNGNGTEYLSLEDASNTINILAFSGDKWVLASGAGAGGGGHIIANEEGNTLEQQKILQFVGFNIENDAANRSTKISNPEPINNLTTTEIGVGSLDAYQGHVLAGRVIPSGGEPGQVLAKSNNIDYQVEWVDKDGDDVITSNGSIDEMISLTYAEYKALEADGQLKPTTQYYITDMGNTIVGLTEASMVEFADGTNLEDRMTTQNIIDSGQNDRLDIAENNIDTIVNTVNTLSQQTTREYCQITYTKSGSIEFTQLYSGVKVPFDRLHSRSGNFTFESNGVKVGAGISKVRVTYGLNVYAVSTPSNFTIQCTAGGYQYTSVDGLSFFTQTCICDVIEGEVIQITVAEQGHSSNTMSFYCHNNQPVCYLLVEKIA